jgi:hypothetical protein
VLDAVRLTERRRHPDLPQTNWHGGSRAACRAIPD